MVLFQCTRCSYEFQKKANYISHVHKQTMCEPIMSEIIPTETNFKKLNFRFPCEICSKTFASKYNLDVHVCKPTNFVINKRNVINGNINNSFNTTNNTTNNTNNNTNNNTTLNIMVNDFKNTNFDFITDDKILRFIKSYRLAIPNLLQETHFNPEHPENHNLYMSNIKNKSVRYKQGDEWLYKNGSEMAEDIINNYHFKMFHSFSEDEDAQAKYPDLKKSYDKYLEITEKEDAKSKIKDDVYEILYNGKGLVTKTNGI
jgi:hypothetical protein